MALDLERFHLSSTFVLLLDEIDDSIDDLISDVRNVRSSFRRSDRVAEGDLLELSF